MRSQRRCGRKGVDAGRDDGGCTGICANSSISSTSSRGCGGSRAPIRASRSAASPRSPPGGRIARRCCSTPSRASRAAFASSPTPPPTAARRAGARHRSGAAAARHAQGLDGEAQDAAPASAGVGPGAAFLQNTMTGAEVDLAKFPAPVWHRHDGGPFIGSGSIVDHARSRRRLDQRLDLSRPGPRPEQRDGAVRPCRPARRHHRQEILGPGQAVPARGRQRRGSGPVHRRFRISSSGPIGIRVRRRHQGRADRDPSGTADRAADSRAYRDRVRRPSCCR